MKWNPTKFADGVDEAVRRLAADGNLGEVERETLRIAFDELTVMVMESEPFPMGYGAPPDPRSLQDLRDLLRTVQARRARAAAAQGLPWSGYPFLHITPEEASRIGQGNVVGGRFPPKKI